MSTSEVGFKKMNWFPKRTAWEDLQLAQEKRQAAAERIERLNTAANGFQTAATMQIQGVGELAAQSAQSRLEAKVQEMQAQIESGFAALDKLV